MKTASETVGVPDREHFAPGEGTAARCATCRYWRHVSRGEGECQIMRPLNGTLGRMITRREDGCNDYERRETWNDELIRTEETKRQAQRRTFLAHRLRVARCAADLPQKRVAEALGISAVHLHCFETGRYFPRTAHLQRLAKLYGVSTEWLLTEEHVRLERP